MPKYGQDSAHLPGEPVGARQVGAGSLQRCAIPHTGGAGRLATAAAEAGVEVVADGRIVQRQVAGLQRPHQDNAAAGAVVFVTSGEVGGAGGQAEPAVDAGVQRGISPARGGFS